MKIDVYSSTGTKKGSLELPAALFEAPINHGLMHQAVILQQSNRRRPIAHVKRRSEVAGATRKLYQQKHTGRARRGSARSPLLRGGGKAFGPRSDRNFSKSMPKNMRRNALLSALSAQAKAGAILGLESYPDAVKTKEVAVCLSKMSLPLAHRILIVTADRHRGLALSTRNIPGVRTISAAYLNPEDVLVARHIIFLVDAIAQAEKIFATAYDRSERAVHEETEKKERNQKSERNQKNQRNPKSQKIKKSTSSTSSK